MKTPPKTTEHVNPNLIPMIDIMFLLLLFFMLGADMGHRELEDLELPRAESARSDPLQERERRRTINAYHRPLECGAFESRRICRNESHWALGFRGKDCTEPAALAMELERTAEGPGQRVILRADAGAPFRLAQRVMNVCAQKGIFKLEMGAAKPPAR